MWVAAVLMGGGGAVLALFHSALTLAIGSFRSLDPPAVNPVVKVLAITVELVLGVVAATGAALVNLHGGSGGILPQAVIGLDPFHCVALGTQAVNEILREVWEA
ncbi:MAG: hypothetical protein ACYDGR_07020 [Candidatus Dormibacteria bacterium]